MVSTDPGLKHDMYLTKRTHEQTRLKKQGLDFFLSEVFPSKDRIKETHYPLLKKTPHGCYHGRGLLEYLNKYLK